MIKMTGTLVSLGCGRIELPAGRGCKTCAVKQEVRPAEDEIGRGADGKLDMTGESGWQGV